MESRDHVHRRVKSWPTSTTASQDRQETPEGVDKLLVYHALLNMRIPISIPICLLLLAGASYRANDKAAGKELLEKARKVSDIRAEGAATFRMEGTFRISSKKGEKEIEGRYTEIWVSKTKWRREAQTGSSHNVEIGAPGKKWLADSGTERLSPALSPRLTLFPELFSRDAPEVTRVSDRQIDSLKMTCIESKSQWSKGIDCVDPGNNVLLVHETSSRSNWTASHHSCIYREYEKFGDHLFPRSVRCVNDPGDDVELTISKLAAEASPEEGLFTKPQGASEIGNCRGVVKAPHAEYSPDPNYPDRHKENMTVVMWTIIGVDGNPQALRVVGSGGKDFDQPALEAVRKWRFKPATCDGLPVAVQINVEVTFRKF
jgi:TonB family protein